MSIKPSNVKLSVKEKISYALGDAAANIAWRGVSTFLFIYYTDVFGLKPATVGLLMFVASLGDGITDIIMGIICDRTNSKYGKFRPWILWTAVPLGLILSLLFISPEFSSSGKIIYAYCTYILFTLIYTANNTPYGALMGVMTSDDLERTSIGSYRMVGAFAGGMLVQGALLFLVAYFGSVTTSFEIDKLGEEKYRISVSSSNDVVNANIKTEKGVAKFIWDDETVKFKENKPTIGKSFSMKAEERYTFIVTGEQEINETTLSVINQKKGYSNSMLTMSFILVLLMLITFYRTRERVSPPKGQKINLKQDLKDLFSNKPWMVLLIIGLLFNIYNSIKQIILVIYFTHYLNNQLLAASFMIGLMLASIGGAMMTAPLGRKIGKRNLFIYAFLFSGAVNSLLFFCSPNDIVGIFSLGMLSQFSAAVFPTLFFVMLGDAADYSEFRNKRRATGLVYAAGSFASKFVRAIGGAIIGFVLTIYNYDGQDVAAIKDAIPGIKMLMSWVPSIVTLLAAGLMFFYPLNQDKMNEITLELNARRENC